MYDKNNVRDIFWIFSSGGFLSVSAAKAVHIVTRTPEINQSLNQYLGDVSSQVVELIPPAVVLGAGFYCTAKAIKKIEDCSLYESIIEKFLKKYGSNSENNTENKETQ